jgi:hypothetical protein
VLSHARASRVEYLASLAVSAWPDLLDDVIDESAAAFSERFRKWRATNRHNAELRGSEIFAVLNGEQTALERYCNSW